MLRRRPALAIALPIAASVIAASLFATSGATSGGSSSVPPNANLWVDTNGGRCTRATSPAAYADSAACPDFAAAYNVAQAGDTVLVKGGSYGPQTVPSRSLGASVVTFAEAPGETVTLGLTSIQSSNVRLDGFEFTGPDGEAGLSISGDGAQIDNVTVSGFKTRAVGIGLANHVTLKDGEVGPMNACAGPAEDGIQVWKLPSTGTGYLTFDGLYIHDITGFPQCGEHVDCVQGFGYSHWVVRNSVFNNCSTSYVFANNEGDKTNPSETDSILIENNSFGTNLDGGNGISIGNTALVPCGSSNLNNIVQNNTFFGSYVATVTCAGNPGGIFRNNVVTNADACWGSGNWQWDYNVVPVGAGCSTTPHAKQCAPTFVDPSHANGNADIVAGDKCAAGAADPINFPPTDIHGARRIAPDAGANAVTPLPSRTKLLASRAKTSACHARGPLPDRGCSPGAIYADATPTIICQSDYPVLAKKLSEKTKLTIYAAYGIPRADYGRRYEIDHIVPIGLGGSNDPANLYPQGTSNASPVFRVKNTLENRLRALVCGGQLKLAPTQRAIARDWTKLYKKIYGTNPPIGTQKAR